MKNIIFIASLCLTLVVSCELLNKSDIQDISMGSIEFSLEDPQGNNLSTSLSEGRNLFVYSTDISSFQASGSGPDGDSFNVSWNYGESCSVDSLIPGDWSITVTSYDDSLQTISQGTVSTTVNSGESVTATVIMEYIPGTGGVSFEITWPVSLDIGSGTVSLDGNSQAIIIDGSNPEGSYTYDTVSAGTDHDFVLQMLRPGGDLAYGASGTVHVTNGQVTPVAINITNYSSAPTAPANLIVENGCFAVELSWDDAEGETGYLIERKERTQSQWTTVGYMGSNESSFRDTSPSSLTLYDYRVVAYNATGETKSLEVQITTPRFSDAIKRAPIAFSEENGFRILDDSTVAAYGSNYYGQLGLASSQLRADGVVIPGLSNILSIHSISTGHVYFMALDELGRVWRLGYLNDGEDHIPSEVTGFDRPIIQLSISKGSFYALDADGRVWAWGSNSYGQLGNGTKTSISSPKVIEALPEIKSIAAGGRHLLALAVNGNVYSCGANNKGQLGLGDTTERLTPELVPGISSAAEVRSLNEINTYVSFVILEDGTLLASGDNYGHKLGLVENQYNSFTQVPGIANVVDVYYNYDATLALDSMGNLYGTGTYSDGSLLDLSEDTDSFTQIVSAPSSIQSLFAGGQKVYCEDTSGVSYTWGENMFGGLMTGEAALNVLPESVVSPASFIQISGGENHYLAIDSDGDVWAWGDNSNGQLGDGTTEARSTPIRILSSASDAIQIAAYGSKSAALLADGSIYLWGSSSSGSVPTQFIDSDLSSGVVEIALGNYHWLARKSDSTVWAWGYNYDSQLGNGTTVSSNDKAIQVWDPVGDGSPLTGAVKILAQARYSTVLLNDGRVVSWGNHILGNGTSYQKASIPVYATGITEGSNLFAGEDTVFAINGGELWKWGQIHGVGHSTPMDFHSTYSPSISGIAEMAFGGTTYPTVIALLNDNSIRVRGANSLGLFGIGNIDHSTAWNTPIGPSGIVDVAMTESSCAALTSSGNLWVWGLNDLGQLGNGEMIPQSHSSPITLPW